MTHAEALRWVFDIIEYFERRDAIHPHPTWTEHGHPQREGWGCYGCDGEFVSVWPQWEKPTLETFPHKPDCRYVAVMRALESAKSEDAVARPDGEGTE